MACEKMLLVVAALLMIFSVRGQQSGGGSSGGSDQKGCLQKVMPCQPYLKTSGKPPAPCCIALGGVIKDDPQCLCSIYNDPKLLKTFNVTKEEAVGLADRCGTKADLSLCTTTGGNSTHDPTTSPPVSPAIPQTSPPGSPKSGGGAGSGGSVMILAITALIGWMSLLSLGV